MSDFTSEVKRILRENKCEFVRKGNGDHEMWKSPIGGKSFPVDSKIKSRHTANGIMKQAGLPKAF
ncbi:type II toxin-antitoxin system HicA family toxin [Bradyrhizobium sp.]|uniref:type II toxin-antitoxin system HicA family toxin n=1 Tax=Bradyrhizobium sp. TaxID=376 RepID=UPI003C7766EE